MIDDSDGTQGAERDKPVTIGQYIDGVEVHIVVVVVKLRTAHRLQLRMPAAPPIEYYLAVIDLLQIGHSACGAIVELALDVRGGGYPVGGREEVEAVVYWQAIWTSKGIPLGNSMDATPSVTGLSQMEMDLKSV